MASDKRKQRGSIRDLPADFVFDPVGSSGWTPESGTVALDPANQIVPIDALDPEVREMVRDIRQSLPAVIGRTLAKEQNDGE